MNTACPDLAHEVLNFDQLLNRCVGDFEFASRLLDRFQEQFQEALIQLDNALSNRDAEALANVAHRVKGATASVSASKLNVLTADIEQLARESNVPAIRPVLEQLHVEWARFSDLAATLLVTEST